VRDAENRGVWMKSSGFGFEEMTPELLVLLDESGNTPQAPGDATSSTRSTPRS